MRSAQAKGTRVRAGRAMACPWPSPWPRRRCRHAVAAAAAPALTPSQSDPDGKPNIVLVILDDLDASAEAQMPRLKSLLADQGVTFTNTMMATPLCAPNRATIFTGLTPTTTASRATPAPRASSPWSRTSCPCG